MTVREALQEGTRLLSGSRSPALDAQLLLADLLGLSRGRLLAEDGRRLAPEEETAYRKRLSRRAAREPVAYITGRREFWKDSFRVTPAVLIPRPETEHLVEAASKFFPTATRLLDIGTGSGCLAISLLHELPRLTEVVACDISPEALAVAEENGRTIFPGDGRLRFVRSDMFENVAEQFDLIVSNPPYVSEAEYAALESNVRDNEPRLALVAGPEGLDCYRRIIAGAGAHLAPGGGLILEVSDATAEKTASLAGEAGLTVLALLPDLAGQQRVLVIQG